jgi:hypothetical protein
MNFELLQEITYLQQFFYYCYLAWYLREILICNIRYIVTVHENILYNLSLVMVVLP